MPSWNGRSPSDLAGRGAAYESPMMAAHGTAKYGSATGARERMILDTGPLVAYLNAADAEHARVAACLDGFSGRLCTTGGVVTEAMYFVSATTLGARVGSPNS